MANRMMRLPRHARLAATWAGFRDARRNLPRLPLTLVRGGPVPAARPSFRNLLQNSVTEAAHRRRTQLFSSEARLAAEVFLAAGVVVEQDAAGSCTEMHLARFRRSLTRWAMRAQAYSEWAKATEAQANQRLECYWGVVLRHHRQLREAAETGRADLSDWRPEPVALDPPWPSPLELLKYWAVDRGTADEYGVLARALKIA